MRNQLIFSEIDEMLPEVKHYPLVDMETVGTQKKLNYLDGECFWMHLFYIPLQVQKKNPNAIIVEPSERPDPKNSAAAVLKAMLITKSQLTVLDDVCDDIYW